MTDELPRWRGVNHLALVTPDMDRTMRFYHGVLGARVVATVGTPSFRHYFFEIGPESTVAFFEYREQSLDTWAKPAGVPYEKAAQFDHVSFNVADETALERLRDRLKAHDCEVTDVVDHGFIKSIYFTDPNGIALEASCWVHDGTGTDADYADRRLFGDADPVPALRELVDSGELAWTPRTELVDGITEDLPVVGGETYRTD